MGDLVSIVVPVYNGAPYIKQCVIQIQNQEGLKDIKPLERLRLLL